MANYTELGIVSLGSSSGKTNVGAKGTLATTAVTADQVVVTYTVTAGKTLHIAAADLIARLTAFAGTATDFGDFSVESPAGTKLYTQHAAGVGVVGTTLGPVFSEPLSIAGGQVVRLVCTPAAATAFTWTGNILGYER
jgi:hypothetical protein